MGKIVTKETEAKIIEYFLSENDNRSVVIAKHFDLNLTRVNVIINNYLDKKMSKIGGMGLNHKKD